MSEVLALPGQVTPVGVILPSDLSYTEWEEIGGRMRGCRESLKWFLGDWLNFGESSYGEKYAQALDATDFDYDYLRNISYVCRNVPLSVRNDKLTFAHHMKVAKLTEGLQKRFLAKALENDWSVRELAAEIKLFQKASEEEEDGVTITPEGDIIFGYKVTIMTTSRGTVSAKDEEEAEKKAVAEAKKRIISDDMTVNLSVLKADENGELS